ncbi:MAG: sugar transferase, partial [Ilumatobacteraceae bacterium]
PAHDEEEYIGRAIRSVLGQDTSGVEILVVDDHSTDRTASIARSFPGVRVVSNPGRGVVDALNHGLDTALGDIVVRLDADDVSLAGGVKHLAAALDLHPAASLAVGRAVFVDRAGNRIAEYGIVPDRSSMRVVSMAIDPIVHSAVGTSTDGRSSGPDSSRSVVPSGVAPPDPGGTPTPSRCADWSSTGSVGTGRRSCSRRRSSSSAPDPTSPSRARSERGRGSDDDGPVVGEPVMSKLLSPTTPTLAERVTEPTRTYRIAKRTFDLVVGVVVAVFAMPVAVVTSLAIVATSRGPVLYTQTRIGRCGRPFTILKFRTMRRGTHEAVVGDPTSRMLYIANGYKLRPDDHRITSVGRVLRKTSLDELPQVLNVIAGHMSIVGVRPLVAEELAERDPYDQALYRSLRPGMTGLWQVTGRSSVAHVDRRALDREYVERAGVLTDVMILLRTPLAVLRTVDAH